MPRLQAAQGSWLTHCGRHFLVMGIARPALLFHGDTHRGQHSGFGQPGVGVLCCKPRVGRLGRGR